MSIFSKLFKSGEDQSPDYSNKQNILHISKVLDIALLTKARHLYDNYQYEQAFPIFQTICNECDDKDAIYHLATCYYQGLGTEQNIPRALEWFKKAARLGDSRAMYNIAATYHNGKGVSRNMEEARKWYMKAAQKGNHRAIAE